MSVLCYHTVDAAWCSGLAMRPADFRQHATWLAQHRQVVDLATAIRLMDRRGRLPRGVTALTFDDGLTGVHEHALPVLRELGLPATVFVVGRTLAGDRTVDWIDDPPSRPLEPLDLEQIRELSAGGIEVASHSYAHYDLPSLDTTSCEEDLRLSREILEDILGGPVAHLAYPRGRHDLDVRRAARKAGYSHAFSLPETAEAVGPFSLPRTGVYRHNRVRMLRAKSTGAYHAMRLHPASGPVRRAARLVRELPSADSAEPAGSERSVRAEGC